MKLTKYEHACILVEQEGVSLLIDPGVLCKTLTSDLESLDAVFVTHQHADHFNVSLIADLLKQFPRLLVFGPKDVVSILQDAGIQGKAVEGGDVLHIGSMKLEVTGHDHAIIYDSVPCMNRGVMVHETVYYAGDDFTKPPSKPKLLAVPASAPWMKAADAMRFITDVSAPTNIPTHNGLLNEFGKDVTYAWLERASRQAGLDWVDLGVGESIVL